MSADEISALFNGAATLEELNKAATAQEKTIAAMDEETQGQLRGLRDQPPAPRSKKSRTDAVKESSPLLPLRSHRLLRKTNAAPRSPSSQREDGDRLRKSDPRSLEWLKDNEECIQLINELARALP